MVLSLAVALAVAAGPTFSGAATVGVSVNTANERASVAPVVALRLGVTQVTPVGIVRGRLATLLPFQASAPLALTTGLASDLGTFLEFERPFAGGGGWRVRLEPFNPSMRLVTFDWANALGRLFPELTGFSPVLSAHLHVGVFDGFVSLRSTARPTTSVPITNRPTNAFFDAMVGASVSWSGWSLEARFVSLSVGPSQRLLEIGVDEELSTVAAAGRASWDQGGGVEAPVDLVTYSRDPTRFERFFKRAERHSTAFGATVSVEGGGGSQQRFNSLVPPHSAVHPIAYGDAQVRLRFAATRVFLAARASTFSFVGADVQGEPVGFLRPNGPPMASLTGFLGADHTFARASLTPGLLFRVFRPATMTTAVDFGGNAPPPGLTGPRTFVLEDYNQVSVFPSDFTLAPRFAAKASLRWTPADALAVVGEFEVLVNPTTTQFFPAGAPLTPMVSVTTQTQLYVQARF